MTTLTRDPRQGDLLSLIDRLTREAPQPAPGSMGVDLRLRSAISEAIRRFQADRYEVAARMSRLLGVEITKAQLDAWTADSKEHSHRLPAAYLPALCAAVGDWTPLRVLAECGGHELHTDPQVQIATQIGRLDAEIREMEARLREKRRVHQLALQTWTTRTGGRG